MQYWVRDDGEEGEKKMAMGRGRRVGEGDFLALAHGQTREGCATSPSLLRLLSLCVHAKSILLAHLLSTFPIPSPLWMEWTPFAHCFVR